MKLSQVICSVLVTTLLGSVNAVATTLPAEGSLNTISAVTLEQTTIDIHVHLGTAAAFFPDGFILVDAVHKAKRPPLYLFDSEKRQFLEVLDIDHQSLKIDDSVEPILFFSVIRLLSPVDYAESFRKYPADMRVESFVDYESLPTLGSTESQITDIVCKFPLYYLSPQTRRKVLEQGVTCYILFYGQLIEFPIKDHRDNP